MFEHLGVINLGTYILGALIIIILPGPNSLYVLATGANQGVKAGYQAATGILLGDSILLLLTSFGASSVLERLPALFAVLRFAGAAYLGFLGMKILWLLLRRPRPSAAPQQVPQPANQFRQRFLKALTLSLLNPKAMLFLLSFFVQFVDPGKGHPGWAFFILSLILQAFSLLYLSALIFMGAGLAAGFRRHQRLVKIANASVGVLFITFALQMGFAR